MAKNWYVVVVPTGKEEVAKSSLEQRIKSKGMNSLINRIIVPKERITEIRGKQKKIIERKRYPGYIFVEMELNDETWLFIKETQGISNFLGGRRPYAVSEIEIQQILLTDSQTEPSAIPEVKIKFKKNAKIRIKEGPFENFEGVIDEIIHSKGLVKVTVVVFNRPTPVELGYWQVEEI
jgi:transcriptional antiterminator NusG